MGEPDFVCAICQRRIDMRWNRRGPDETLPPVCRSCEREYSRPATVKGGSFRDRRVAAQIDALAEALRCEAARKSWPQAWSILREA